MKTLLKIMLASSLGALIGLSLANQLGATPLVTVLSVIVCAAVALVTAGFRTFKSEFKIAYAKCKTKLQDAKAKRLAITVAQKRNAMLYRAYCLSCLKSDLVGWGAGCIRLFWYALAFIAPIALVHSAFSTGGDLMDKCIYSLRNSSLIALLIAGFVYLLISTACLMFTLTVTKLDLESKFLIAQIRKLEADVSQHWKILARCLVFPFFALIAIAKNIAQVAKCSGIALVKTSYAIANFELWTAVASSLAGFAIGWFNGRSEILGCLSGGLIGGALYLTALFLLKVLPKRYFNLSLKDECGQVIWDISKSVGVNGPLGLNS